LKDLQNSFFGSAMRIFTLVLLLVSSSLAQSFFPISAATATSSRVSGFGSTSTMSAHKENQDTTYHPFCDLPGDPSLILTTNVDLAEKKMDIMKGM